jgi:hypothetical protein
MWWEHWFDDVVSGKIDELTARRLVVPKDGLLEVQTSLLTSPYWMHVSGSKDCRNCTLWHAILFKQFGVIHHFCRYNCWKVVTKPRNVMELIKTYNLMYVIPFVYNFINPLPGKAGLDVRDYTDKPYAVFQYTTSLTEGLRVKEIMIHMITEYLPNDEIDGKHLQDTVFLKRSCTEFEQAIPGDSKWWNEPQTPDEIELERRLEDILHCPNTVDVQPAWLKDKTLNKWLRYANSIGDYTAIDMMGKDTFNVVSRKYTAEDLQSKGGDDKKVLTEKEKEDQN